jgi:hypothetical protein
MTKKENKEHIFSIAKIIQYMIFGILGTLVFSSPPIHLALSSRPLRTEVVDLLKEQNKIIKSLDDRIKQLEFDNLELKIKLNGLIDGK